jgi:hypothetical protein
VNVDVITLTWQKKSYIMSNLPLSGYTALVDYKIWISFNFSQGKYYRHTSREKILCQNEHVSFVSKHHKYTLICHEDDTCA